MFDVRCSRATKQKRKRKREAGGVLLTGGAGSVFLDGLSLLVELVLGRGETALDGRADGGSAELGGQARGAAEDLALEKHGDGFALRSGREGRLFLGLCQLRLFW